MIFSKGDKVVIIMDWVMENPKLQRVLSDWIIFDEFKEEVICSKSEGPLDPRIIKIQKKFGFDVGEHLTKYNLCNLIPSYVPRNTSNSERPMQTKTSKRPEVYGDQQTSWNQTPQSSGNGRPPGSDYGRRSSMAAETSLTPEVATPKVNYSKESVGRQWSDHLMKKVHFPPFERVEAKQWTSTPKANVNESVPNRGQKRRLSADLSSIVPLKVASAETMGDGYDINDLKRRRIAVDARSTLLQAVPTPNQIELTEILKLRILYDFSTGSSYLSSGKYAESHHPHQSQSLLDTKKPQMLSGRQSAPEFAKTTNGRGA